MPTDWVTLLVTAILSGGACTAVASIITARAMSRQATVREKSAPAEIQSILLGGAEKAVASLVVALEWAEVEIRELKEESEASRLRELAKDARIAELETSLVNMQAQLGMLQDRVTRVQHLAQDARSDPSPEN